MALIQLFLIGFLAGWFASILARIEEKSAIRTLILVSLIASVGVGLLVNGGTFLGSLSWLATGAAMLATLAALIGYHFYLRRRPEV